MLRRERTLLIEDVTNLQKPNDFLDSKSRNSPQTKKTYLIALAHLQTFLINSQYKEYNIESVLKPLESRIIDVYKFIDKFVDYLVNRQDAYFGGKKLKPTSVIAYVAGVRSYLEFYDVDISPRKFQNKVTLPRKHRSDPEPIDETDIANMLNACSNKRLRAFIFLLATTGMRANEALLLKNSDIDFEQSPTKIHIRAEITKRKQGGRDIFTTDEASKHLKIFIESKYKNIKYSPDHILFKLQDNNEEHKGKLYGRLMTHFSRLLQDIGLDKRKDGDGQQRRKISFHSFRRFVKTTISDQGHEGYSEWLLGHRSQVANLYYNSKPDVRRDLYKKLEKHLTFLDTTVFKTKTREIESKVEQNEKEFESKLKERDQEVEQLRDKILNYEMEEQENKKEVENMRDYVNKKVNELSKKDKEISTLQEQAKNNLQKTAFLLHNYFVSRGEDKFLVDMNNEQVARAIKSGELKIDIDDLHLAPKYLKPYNLDKKQTKSPKKKQKIKKS